MHQTDMQERLQFAVDQLKAHGIEFRIKNVASGHMHCHRKSDDALVQYWAGTGTILAPEGRLSERGLRALLQHLES